MKTWPKGSPIEKANLSLTLKKNYKNSKTSSFLSVE